MALEILFIPWGSQKILSWNIIYPKILPIGEFPSLGLLLGADFFPMR
ncbi:hypothetical protein HMPREF0578_0193 [Mobiluncus mulieris 28-1]|uniref:Uncharacterized protein n=2 Tax=Mobiluncus mulieris TaxID=2052 RepID=E0QR52_9ACTO|nr:hypothetical protein HMPREF0577_0751 [Mobiluncus mulieris ATCC 35243]EEZ90288.1 hypothetical protein HMPREF0578_0193 [Mobiluncus mulieris 28-1]EFM46045.1 hypothetical protein HMPREF0580_1367 [Mobiluncus mulieris ATCC 35239]MCU9969193.1 nitrate ABC transporter [Mobiluncus mulieris]MCU9970083.1 nitrate ABC transporter [Mobiluncus mulieris]